MNMQDYAASVLKYALALRTNRKDYDEEEPEEYAQDSSGHEHSGQTGQFVSVPEASEHPVDEHDFHGAGGVSSQRIPPNYETVFSGIFKTLRNSAATQNLTRGLGVAQSAARDRQLKRGGGFISPNTDLTDHSHVGMNVGTAVTDRPREAIFLTNPHRFPMLMPALSKVVAAARSILAKKGQNFDPDTPHGVLADALDEADEPRAASATRLGGAPYKDPMKTKNYASFMGPSNMAQPKSDNTVTRLLMHVLQRGMEELSRYKKDSSGHEHAPKGEHGGQFVSEGNEPEQRREPGELAQVGSAAKNMAIHGVLGAAIGTLAAGIAYAGKNIIGAMAKFVQRNAMKSHIPASALGSGVVDTSELISRIPAPVYSGLNTLGKIGVGAGLAAGIGGLAYLITSKIRNRHKEGMSRSLDNRSNYVKDKTGHEHKGKGKGGGQFTGKGESNGSPKIGAGAGIAIGAGGAAALGAVALGLRHWLKNRGVVDLAPYGEPPPLPGGPPPLPGTKSIVMPKRGWMERVVGDFVTRRVKAKANAFLEANKHLTVGDLADSLRARGVSFAESMETTYYKKDVSREKRDESGKWAKDGKKSEEKGKMSKSGKIGLVLGLVGAGLAAGVGGFLLHRKWKDSRRFSNFTTEDMNRSAQEGEELRQKMKAAVHESMDRTGLGSGGGKEYYLSNGEIVYKNPNPLFVKKMLREGKAKGGGAVRGYIDGDDLYMWNEAGGHHEHVTKEIGVHDDPFNDKNFLSRTFWLAITDWDGERKPTLVRRSHGEHEGKLKSWADDWGFRWYSRDISTMSIYKKDSSGHEHAKDGKFTGPGQGGEKERRGKEETHPIGKFPSVKNHSVYVMNSKIAGVLPKFFGLHHRSLAFCPKGADPVTKDGKSHPECKVYGLQPGQDKMRVEPQRHSVHATEVKSSPSVVARHVMEFNQKYNVISNNCQHAVSRIIQRIKEKSKESSKRVYARFLSDLIHYAKHDVSDEARDKTGKWTSGGSSDTRPEYRKRKHTHWEKAEQEGKGKRDPSGRFAPGGGATNKGKLQEQSSVKGLANKGLIIALSSVAAGLVGTAAAHQAGILPKGMGFLGAVPGNIIGGARRMIGWPSVSDTLRERIREEKAKKELGGIENDKVRAAAASLDIAALMTRAYTPPPETIPVPETIPLLPAEKKFVPPPVPTGTVPEGLTLKPSERVELPPMSAEEHRKRMMEGIAARKAKTAATKKAAETRASRREESKKPYDPWDYSRDLYDATFYQSLKEGLDSTEASFLAAEAEYNAQYAPRQTGQIDIQDPSVREATVHYLRQIGMDDPSIEAELLSLMNESTSNSGS